MFQIRHARFLHNFFKKPHLPSLFPLSAISKTVSLTMARRAAFSHEKKQYSASEGFIDLTKGAKNAPPKANQPKTGKPSSSESFDITMESAQQWEKAVMQSPIPVVVEALAEWDANSQKLDSILTAKIKNFGGKIRLVRFDIEKLPDVAKALAIRNVPTVFLVSKGKGVDGFSGSPDNQIIDQFLSKALSLATSQGQTDPTPKLQETFQAIEKDVENGDYEKARTALETLIQESGAASKPLFVAKSLAGLAYIAFKQGNEPNSHEYLRALLSSFADHLEDPDVKKYAVAIETGMKNRQEAQNDPKLKELSEKVAENPKDSQSRFDLAQLQFKYELYENGIENLLELIKRDKNWSEKKAQKVLLEIFGKLGNQNKLVLAGRKKLQGYLYR